MAGYPYSNEPRRDNSSWLIPVVILIVAVLLFILFVWPALQANDIVPNQTNVNVETTEPTNSPTTIPSPTVTVEPTETPTSTRSASPTRSIR